MELPLEVVRMRPSDAGMQPSTSRGCTGLDRTCKWPLEPRVSDPVHVATGDPEVALWPCGPGAQGPCGPVVLWPCGPVATEAPVRWQDPPKAAGSCPCPRQAKWAADWIIGHQHSTSWSSGLLMHLLIQVLVQIRMSWCNCSDPGVTSGATPGIFVQLITGEKKEVRWAQLTTSHAATP